MGESSRMAGRAIGYTAERGIEYLQTDTFEWDFGDGSPVVTSTYYNGGTFPFTATDTQTHSYSMVRRYDVKVRVRDDDGGAREFIVTVFIL